MQDIALKIFRAALNKQGQFMLYSALAGLAYLSFDAPQKLLGVPIVVIFLGFLVGAFLTTPHWQPKFLRAPQGIASASAALLVASLIPLLAITVSTLAVLSFGMAASTEKIVVILAALPTIVLSGATWVTAIALMVLQPTDPSDGLTPA